VQLYREANAEQHREHRVHAAIDEQSDDALEGGQRTGGLPAGCVETSRRVVVEVHHEHAAERDAAEHVEVVEAFGRDGEYCGTVGDGAAVVWVMLR
jgi:hypothetical protein